MKSNQILIKIGTALVLVLGLGTQPSFSAEAGAPANLLKNGSFEAGTEGWRTWASQEGSIKIALDDAAHRAGSKSLLIANKGDQDWCLRYYGDKIDVKPGETYDLSVWVKMESGTADLNVITQDAKNEALEWNFASAPCGESKEWARVTTSVEIPSGCVSISPRLTGSGNAKFWCESWELVKMH